MPYGTGGSTQYRSANGEPGEAYWQNAADYAINAQLYPSEHRIETTITINYTNNSPQNLNFVWLQFDQDLFEQDLSWRSISMLANTKLNPFFNSLASLLTSYLNAMRASS